jgi:hypothetical protein
MSQKIHVISVPETVWSGLPPLLCGIMVVPARRCART